MTNHLWWIVTLTAFGLLPILALITRAFGPRWFTGAVACCVVALLGWVLVNANIYFGFEDACETMRRYGSNPPQDIADACTVDGAARVFGVLLGGFYALIYYAPFALALLRRATWQMARVEVTRASNREMCLRIDCALELWPDK